MVEQHLERAFLLLQQGRSHDAAAEARRALTLEPTHPIGLGILAVCNLNAKEFGKGLELARQAVAQDAEHPWLMLVLARAQFLTQDTWAARQTLQAGQQVAPDYAPFWELLGEVEMYDEKWEAALAAADRGLALDPDDVDLVNLRSRALVKLSRTGEAAETLAYALNKAPGDPYSHANQGWVMVEQDRYDEAIESFKEALRINPNLEHARSGLKEAIKGKNLFYRVLLKYFLWMDKMSSAAQWGIIIAFYIGSRFLRRMSEMEGWAGMLGMGLFGLYILFAYSTWIGKPVSNLFLRLHPVGNLALDDDERKGSNWVGSLLALGAALLAAGYFLPEDLGKLLWMGGLVAMLMLIPVGGLFSVPPGTATRRNMGWYAGGLAAAGVLGLFMPGLFAVFAIGLFAYGWVANYLMQKEWKRFR